jgi:hypothetical protein
MGIRLAHSVDFFHLARGEFLIISGQSALSALVQLAMAIEGKWMGGNHKTGEKFFAELHQNFPSRVWKCVGWFNITPPWRSQSAIHSIISVGLTVGQPNSA